MTGDFIWCRKKSCRIVTVRGKPSRQKNPIDLYAETRKIDPKNYDQKYITDNRTGRKKKQNTHAQAVTENLEKTADQNVPCLKKELQQGNGEKTIDVIEIKNTLLQNEKLNSSRIQTSPPVRVTNSSSSINTSNISENMFDLDFLSSQDEDLGNILEELQNGTEVSGNNITEITSSNCLKRDFCSDTIFNLSHRVLSKAEIKILGKVLNFPPIQRKTNEPELRK